MRLESQNTQKAQKEMRRILPTDGTDYTDGEAQNTEENHEWTRIHTDDKIII